MSPKAILAAAVMLAGCSPSAPPSPPSAAAAKPTPPRVLPTDFLGIQLGTLPPRAKCGEVKAVWPCMDVLGNVTVEPTIVPTGLDYDLDVRLDEGGKITQITATVQRGHDGRITGNLVTKYGSADYAPGNGELQWNDGKTVVAYYPAKPYDEGWILVSTAEAVEDDNQRAQEARNRKL